MNMSFRHNNHARPSSSSCKGTPGSILKYEAFLYIHAQLPNGEFVALRFRNCDGHILRCDQPRRSPSCTRRRSAQIVIGDIEHAS